MLFIVSITQFLYKPVSYYYYCVRVLRLCNRYRVIVNDDAAGMDRGGDDSSGMESETENTASSVRGRRKMRYCPPCLKEVDPSNWARHLRSQSHSRTSATRSDVHHRRRGSFSPNPPRTAVNLLRSNPQLSENARVLSSKTVSRDQMRRCVATVFGCSANSYREFLGVATRFFPSFPSIALEALAEAANIYAPVFREATSGVSVNPDPLSVRSDELRPVGRPTYAHSCPPSIDRGPCAEPQRSTPVLPTASGVDSSTPLGSAELVQPYSAPVETTTSGSLSGFTLAIPELSGPLTLNTSFDFCEMLDHIAALPTATGSPQDIATREPPANETSIAISDSLLIASTLTSSLEDVSPLLSCGSTSLVPTPGLEVVTGIPVTTQAHPCEPPVSTLEQNRDLTTKPKRSVTVHLKRLSSPDKDLTATSVPITSVSQNLELSVRENKLEVVRRRLKVARCPNNFNPRNENMIITVNRNVLQKGRNGNLQLSEPT